MKLLPSLAIVLLLGACSDREPETTTYGDSATPAPPATTTLDSMERDDLVPGTTQGLERQQDGMATSPPPATDPTGSMSAAPDAGAPADRYPSTGTGGASMPFATVDEDADGKLSEEEAQKFPELNSVFYTADTDKDGFLSSAEYSRIDAGTGQIR